MAKPKLQFRLSQKLLDQLDRLALLEHRTKSNLVENIVREYFERHKIDLREQKRSDS